MTRERNGKACQRCGYKFHWGETMMSHGYKGPWTCFKCWNGAETWLGKPAPGENVVNPVATDRKARGTT